VVIGGGGSYIDRHLAEVGECRQSKEKSPISKDWIIGHCPSTMEGSAPMVMNKRQGGSLLLSLNLRKEKASLRTITKCSLDRGWIDKHNASSSWLLWLCAVMIEAISRHHHKHVMINNFINLDLLRCISFYVLSHTCYTTITPPRSVCASHASTT